MWAQGAGTNYEAVRKQCWAITIGGLDVTLLAKSCNVPVISHGKVTMHHMNEEVKGMGAPTCGDLTVEIYDVIAPSVFNDLETWASQGYDPRTGQMGYASDYKRQIIIDQLDQKGNSVRTWNCYGCFPLNHPSPDGLDYASQEPSMLRMQFSCDRAYPDGGTGTGGQIGSTFTGLNTAA
jgi:hypothetical protein